MIRPTNGYPTRTAAIEALLAEGKTAAEIVAEIGGTRNSVDKLIWQSARRVSDRRVTLPRVMIDLLGEQAAARGMDGVGLATRLLEVVIRDELYDALLGEPEVARA